MPVIQSSRSEREGLKACLPPCRFTANPSGTDKSGKTTDAEKSSGGLLSGILPKSNQGEGRDGKSLGDKASDQYDSAKQSAQETQDKIAEQV